MTAKTGHKFRRAMRAADERDRKRNLRGKLAQLKAHLRTARAARKAAITAAIEHCRMERRALAERTKENRKRALLELRAAADAQRLAAREACRARKAEARGLPAWTQARAALTAETKLRRKLREVAKLEKRGRLKRPRSTADERKVELEEATRREISPELLPLYDKIGKGIRGNDPTSKAEAFLHYAMENPAEVLAAQGHEADVTLKRLIAEHQATDRELRRKPTTRPPSSGPAAFPAPSSSPRSSYPSSWNEVTPPSSFPASSWDDREASEPPSIPPAARAPTIVAEPELAPAPRKASTRPPPPPKPPSAFALKRQARIDRMRRAAGKMAAESTARLKSARATGDRIPMGQPILVGHHSEKRHRRDLARIDAGYRKAFELQKNAEGLTRRADAAEKGRGGISSDDPEAVAQLRAKLRDLNESREKWKEINATLRRRGDVMGNLAKLGLNTATAQALLRKDFAGRVGIPDYRIKNSAAEARRIEQRIEQLEARAAAKPKGPETLGPVTITEADNRVRMEFPGKPSDAIRTRLKRMGFKWAPSVGAWQRHASNAAWYHARAIAKLVAAASAPPAPLASLAEADAELRGQAPGDAERRAWIAQKPASPFAPPPPAPEEIPFSAFAFFERTEGREVPEGFKRVTLALRRTLPEWQALLAKANAGEAERAQRAGDLARIGAASRASSAIADAPGELAARDAAWAIENRARVAIRKSIRSLEGPAKSIAVEAISRAGTPSKATQHAILKLAGEKWDALRARGTSATTGAEINRWGAEVLAEAFRQREPAAPPPAALPAEIPFAEFAALERVEGRVVPEDFGRAVGGMQNTPAEWRELLATRLAREAQEARQNASMRANRIVTPAAIEHAIRQGESTLAQLTAYFPEGQAAKIGNEIYRAEELGRISRVRVEGEVRDEWKPGADPAVARAKEEARLAALETTRTRTPASVKAPELKDTTQIAAAIRKDIAAAVKSGKLPGKPTWIYSVKTSKYSMGSSINVFAHTPKGVYNADGYVLEGSRGLALKPGATRYTPAAEKVRTTLVALVEAHHWDKSDLMTDYHSSRFHFEVSLVGPAGEQDKIHSELRAQLEKPAQDAAVGAALAKHEATGHTVLETHRGEDGMVADVRALPRGNFGVAQVDTEAGKQVGGLRLFDVREAASQYAKGIAVASMTASTPPAPKRPSSRPPPAPATPAAATAEPPRAVGRGEVLDLERALATHAHAADVEEQTAHTALTGVERMILVQLGRRSPQDRTKFNAIRLERLTKAGYVQPGETLAGKPSPGLVALTEHGARAAKLTPSAMDKLRELQARRREDGSVTERTAEIEQMEAELRRLVGLVDAADAAASFGPSDPVAAQAQLRRRELARDIQRAQIRRKRAMFRGWYGVDPGEGFDGELDRKMIAAIDNDKVPPATKAASGGRVLSPDRDASGAVRRYFEGYVGTGGALPRTVIGARTPPGWPVHDAAAMPADGSGQIAFFTTKEHAERAVLEGERAARALLKRASSRPPAPAAKGKTLQNEEDAARRMALFMVRREPGKTLEEYRAMNPGGGAELLRGALARLVEEGKISSSVVNGRTVWTKPQTIAPPPMKAEEAGPAKVDILEALVRGTDAKDREAAALGAARLKRRVSEDSVLAAIDAGVNTWRDLFAWYPASEADALKRELAAMERVEVIHRDKLNFYRRGVAPRATATAQERAAERAQKAREARVEQGMTSAPTTAPLERYAPTDHSPDAVASRSYSAWCDLVSKAAGKHGRIIRFGDGGAFDAWNKGVTAEAFVLAQPLAAPYYPPRPNASAPLEEHRAWEAQTKALDKEAVVASGVAVGNEASPENVLYAIQHYFGAVEKAFPASEQARLRASLARLEAEGKAHNEGGKRWVSGPAPTSRAAAFDPAELARAEGVVMMRIEGLPAKSESLDEIVEALRGKVSAELTRFAVERLIRSNRVWHRRDDVRRIDLLIPRPGPGAVQPIPRLRPKVPAAKDAGSKVVATSTERHRASAAERRQYGGDTVTTFFVHFARDGAPSMAYKWEKIDGYGKTPGERKTDAIRRFLEMESKREAGVIPTATDWDAGERYTRNRVRCHLCGCTANDHRTADGKCPATASWGAPAPFPKLTQGTDEQNTDRLARYWSMKKTTFFSVK
jgi:hypothetical protein